MNAMPLLIGAIAVFILAYRFYYSFVAAKVLTLNDYTYTLQKQLLRWTELLSD